METSAFVRRGALAVLSAWLASSCAIEKNRPDTSGVSGVSDTYGWFFYGSDVRNGLPDTDARPQSYARCGHERGAVRLFREPGRDTLEPHVWLDDRVWRKYSRPAGPAGCAEGETRDDTVGTCWRSYGIQFYPSSPVPQNNRFRVAGTSPILRVIPKDEYPKKDAWCRFQSDQALIWVAGVNNRGLGLAWHLIDNELLASILAWHRNYDLPAAVGAEPAGHGKLKGELAYYQIVQNDNAPADGAVGTHSEVAIKQMAANFELAYRAGIKRLEVVSHSNGVITAQLAYALFAQRFVESRWNETDWVGTWSPDVPSHARADKASLLADRRQSGAPELMTVNFYHLQAAPSQRWANGKLDSFGFYSDLTQTAKWVWKSVSGFGYWGWDWYKPDAYADAARFLKPQFRFYYNGGDWMTYDYYRYSSVGRRESLPWQAEVQKHLQSEEGLPFVSHYVCPSNRFGVCGPGHEQADSLWFFSSPAMPATNKPIVWERQ